MALTPTKKRRTQIGLVVVALLGSFILGFGTASNMSSGWIGQQITAARLGKSKPDSVNFDLFWQTWNQVHQDFVGKIDDQQLIYGAIKGMVSGLDDPYTIFFDPNEAKRFSEDVTGKFFGIGIEIGVRNKALTVITPLDDSPANKAGLKSGDVIVRIDDKDTSDMTLNDAVSKIRGDKGSTVKLTIVPKDTSDLKEVSIVRDLIQVKSVKYEVKSNDIGYVRITQFSEDTTDLTTKALNDLKSKHVKGIILDLRNNPGGYLTGAQEVGGMFISRGVVVSEQGKDGKKNDLYTVADPIVPDLPLVVLVNGGSASASEIVSGAIQDRERGKLVGEKTFGKGSVQNIKDLPGGSSLKVTIAEWLTPKGRMINKLGIAPDVEVKLTADDEKAGRDPQLDKAIELIHQK